MRRENRRRDDDGIKTWVYVSGSVILLLIISFVIGVMFFNNKIENDVNESQFSTSKISDLVPNVITNQIDSQEASSSMGKTVNELENEVENSVKNTIEENVITNNEIEENEQDKEVTNIQNTQIQEEIEVSETSKIESNNQTIEEEQTMPVFVKPVEGEILREFAKEKLVYSETLQEWITHNGIDIKADKTTVVKSSAEGKISSIKNDPRYGLTVTIEHDNGFKSIYANLLTAEFVTEGEVVQTGQTIGTVGNTATFEILDEPHLHFEIIKDGEYVDPTIYIK